MTQDVPRDAVWGWIAIAASVGLISALHYLTSTRSAVLHEILQGLYYIPIVVAAVVYGAKAGLATSLFASVLYLPHIVMTWGAVPTLEMDRFGDVLLFNLVAGVTGALADQLRAERNRYRQVSLEVQAVNRALEVSTDERIQADRLVTIGRLASGIAHEVRNPLGALQGCLEILEQVSGLPAGRQEFIAIARTEVARLNRVVGEFLEFARPASAARTTNDLAGLVESAVLLAWPNLAGRGVEVQIAAGAPVIVFVDGEQLQRALVNLLLDRFAARGAGPIRISVTGADGLAQARIEVPGTADVRGLAAELFEPFPEHGDGHGLSLAVARRLIENQGGRVRAEVGDERLCYVIEIPLSWSRPLSVLTQSLGRGA